MKNTKLLALVILLLSILAIIVGFWGPVTMVAGAGVAAYLLTPLVRLLRKKLHLPRIVAVLLVIAALLGLVAGLAAYTVPALVRELSGLISELSHFSKNMDGTLADVVRWLQDSNVPQPMIDSALETLARLDEYLSRFLSGLLSTVLTISSGVVDFIVIVIMMIYFLLDWEKLMDGFVNAFPGNMRSHIVRLRLESHAMFWSYVGSRCIVCTIMALATYIGLSIIGLPYAFLFAITSFVLDFIPYFGSALACIIETVVALFTGGLSMALKTAVFVLIVQLIEGNIIAPKLESRSVGIHPITVLFSLLACQQLWGPVGMLVSTPLAALVKMVLGEIKDFALSTDEERAAAPAHEPDAPILVTEETGS
jgi:predicted PurR-regulated permease PerM